MHINHPLPLNTKVLAKKQKCSCQGGGFTEITATILKVITNNTGFWYYLDNQTTIQASWVIQVIK